MANEQIIAFLRLANIARFRRDAKNAADDIEKIGDAAKKSDSPVSQLGGALSELTDALPNLTGRTRIFGFAVGTVLTAALASLPILTSLLGSTTALAGSAGAAAIGMGALGIAFAGAMVPLGGFGLVVADALTGFKKIKDAQAAYSLAVAAFGRESQQAETALMRLNGTVELFGGQAMVDAVDGTKAFVQAWREATAPAMQNLALILTDALSAANRLLPVFSEVVNLASAVVRSGLNDFFREMSGGEMQGVLKTLGSIFADLAPVLIKSATNFLIGFFQIAARLGPVLQFFADELFRASGAFRDWATGGNLDTFVSQFYAWYNLLKSVGGLLVTILDGGATTGQSLVVTLTEIVNRWNEWLQGAKGQNAMGKFFADAANLTKAFVGALADVVGFFFRIASAAMPIYTVVLGALSEGFRMVLDAIAPLKPLWDNVLWPFLEGLVMGVLGDVVGAFKVLVFIVKVVAIVLGFLGKLLAPLSGAFRILGEVVGFIFGGWILKAISWIGKISILLRPLGSLFKLLAAPINLVGRLFGWLGAKFGSLMLYIANGAKRIPSIISRAFNAVLDWITGAGSKFYDAGRSLWNFLKNGLIGAIGSGLGEVGEFAQAIANAVIDLLNDAIPNKLGPANLPNNPIPRLATGGVVSGVGSWITGESGPELNTLTSGGQVVVKPLAPGVSAQSTNATVAPQGGGKRTIVSKIYLKGRQIAEAVADEAEDEKSR